MAYSDKVIDHYNNPRNVGSLDKNDPNVGTGLVGAPECGDVMKLQIKVKRSWRCKNCKKPYEPADKLVDIKNVAEGLGADRIVPLGDSPCCSEPDIILEEFIEEAKFKTFGCGSAIASSSLATEWVKGKTVEEALAIKNTEIVKELSLPPVKIHCSVLAEDAIKAAIADWKKKTAGPETGPA
ncbi:MAG: iron-sulfur cluster assembly scaffold protein [Candidatus Liptonbacteria bacterium]|nr:iron-sulfur cluster assembly scaffold protein [Candidatus Liptonbacteria bacterium]